MGLVFHTDASTAIAGLMSIEAGVEAATRLRARSVAQRVLDDALDIVHIISGNLAATGRIEDVDASDTYEVRVVFGDAVGIDRFVDYAEYEEDLHPFLRPAFDAHRNEFPAALVDAVDDAL